VHAQSPSDYHARGNQEPDACCVYRVVYTNTSLSRRCVRHAGGIRRRSRTVRNLAAIMASPRCSSPSRTRRCCDRSDAEADAPSAAAVAPFALNQSVLRIMHTKRRADLRPTCGDHSEVVRAPVKEATRRDNLFWIFNLAGRRLPMAGADARAASGARAVGSARFRGQPFGLTSKLEN